MTISGTLITSNLYATTVNLKARLGIAGTSDDTILGMVLAGVSRAIDEYCGDWFYRDTVATVRYFTAARPDHVDIDPVVSASALVTDLAGLRAYATTWASTDYDLLPANVTPTNRPYRMLETRTGSLLAFPLYPLGVKLTAIYGWPAVPEQITEAALLWSARLYKRKDAAFGVSGFSETGEMRVLKDMDPDTTLLLEPFVRPQKMRGRAGEITLQHLGRPR